MMRQLRYRDGSCRFPGCDARRYTQAHHIEWWSRGGVTDLDNLLLICSFHHTLVHERGWSITEPTTVSSHGTDRAVSATEPGRIGAWPRSRR